MSTWAQTATQAALLLTGAALFGVLVGALLARAFRRAPAAAPVPEPSPTVLPWRDPEPPAAVAAAPAHTAVLVPEPAQALTFEPQAVPEPEAAPEPEAVLEADAAPEPAALPEPTPVAAGTSIDVAKPIAPAAATAEIEQLREQLRRAQERVAALGAEILGMNELNEVEFGRLEAGALRVLDDTIATHEARLDEAEQQLASLHAEHEQTTARLHSAMAEVERLLEAIAWRDGRLHELAEQLRQHQRP